MHRAKLLCVAFLFFLQTTTHCHGASVQPDTSGCIPREREALLAFKKGITSDPKGFLASWRRGSHEQEDCCRWRGVECSNHTGRVLKLHLGHFPNEFDDSGSYNGTGMIGLISPSLVSLEDLRHLDLSWNSLKGPSGSIPGFLGSLRSLRYLNLSNMPFAGMVPHQLGNLSKLQILDLSGCNELKIQSGSGMAGLRYLPWLQYLNLASVYLGEVDDWPHAVNTLPYLRVLNLSRCSLQRTNQLLPRVNLTRLETLDLSQNSFNHPVASCWFWNLTNLKYLNLAYTQLYGMVPNALADMTSIQVLDFSFNRAVSLELLDLMPSSQTPVSSSDDTDAADGTGINIRVADLRNLCNLEILYLTQSLLSGNITELLEGLVQCPSSKLQELRLAENNITGMLPNSIGMFSTLVSLDLSKNLITGHIPSDIGMLKKLTYLDLSNNALDHLPSEIGMLKHLTHLDLSNNALHHLPDEIGMVEHLTHLDLSNNALHHLPDEIGMLTELAKLYLYNNHLEGIITEKHFAFLSSLKEIYLINNSLNIVVDPEWLPPFRLQRAYFSSCRMGPNFPTWLQSQVDIIELDISNANITDELPQWFSTVFSKAIILDISYNKIHGDLPKNMEIMSLEVFYLSSNNITGEIPRLPRNLKILDMSKNSISGHLPSNNWAPNLAQLNLFSNRVSGHVPVYFCELHALQVLDLANNLFEGELPGCFGMENTALEFLRLRKNAFSGSFPSLLRGCIWLHFVDLSLNKFSGKLPKWIGNLSNLRILQLNSNMFSGNIPVSITKLKELRHLDLAGNKISGAIPKHLSTMLAMTGKPYNKTQTIAALGADYNSPITMKGDERYYNEEKVEVTTIDLSSNFLTGGIPGEIVLLGNLLNLNLSRNYLSGTIPGKIGAMQKLLSLDFSRNKLNGEIPPSLSNLTSLSFLDLAYNNLTGRIPQGSQLETLYAQNPNIYHGNEGLCGPPLQKKCSSNDPPKQGHPISVAQDSHIEPFFMAVILGFIAGLWVDFCVLLFKKSWRVTYFRSCDKMYDKIYVVLVVGWARLTRKTAQN